MNHYLVFAKLRVGGNPLAPGFPRDPIRDAFVPVGVWGANSGDDACKAAAKKVGQVGTYFAVEGSPWGVDMLDVEGVHELGEEETPDAQQVRIRELERQLLERGDE